MEYVQRGDIRHSSFAFRVFPGGDEWGVSEFNYPMRTLHAVELIDVAPVLDPAYPDAARAGPRLDGAVRSLSQWVQARRKKSGSGSRRTARWSSSSGPDNIGPAARAGRSSRRRSGHWPGALALLGPARQQQGPYADE